jgi:nicotinamide riboside transporter PnuC
MLPERERHALREIEEELRASDPALAEVLSRRPWLEAWRRKLLLVLSDITAVALFIVGIIANEADLVLWGTLSTGALVWLHVVRAKRRRAAESPDPSPK